MPVPRGIITQKSPPVIRDRVSYRLYNRDITQHSTSRYSLDMSDFLPTRMHVGGLLGRWTSATSSDNRLTRRRIPAQFSRVDEIWSVFGLAQLVDVKHLHGAIGSIRRRAYTVVYGTAYKQFNTWGWIRHTPGSSTLSGYRQCNQMSVSVPTQFIPVCPLKRRRRLRHLDSGSSKPLKYSCNAINTGRIATLYLISNSLTVISLPGFTERGSERWCR